MPVDKLIARARLISLPPEREPLDPSIQTRKRLSPFPPPFTHQQHPAIGPPHAEPDNSCCKEATGRKRHPVSPHPENQSRIPSVPAASSMPPKESPRLFIIFVSHQYPHPPLFRAIPMPVGRNTAQHRRGGALVFLPDYTQEKRTGAVHDCYVGKLPIAIIGDQRFDYEGEEGVVRDTAHGVI